MNPETIKATWTEVESYGREEVAKFFYSTLFIRNPGIEDLFPDDMRPQMAHLVGLITTVVRSADNLDAVAPRLQRLGEDHRRYGALAEHYPPVADALLATLKHYLDDRWTLDVAKTWAEALDIVAGVMITAANQAIDIDSPASWEAVVLEVEREDPGGAWIIFDPGDSYPWQPGQQIPVGLPGQPGTERTYTPEALTGSTALAIHVPDVVDPTTLALLNNPGRRLRLGAPFAQEDQ